jgi:glycerophosphoryl diester phosphodiesterase
MAAPRWLTARPFAHRGLHDAAAGVIENTASAFTAAIDGRYGIECDVQVSADGEAMVFHDDSLGRLTEGNDLLASRTARDLKAVRFRATGNRMLTLAELADLVAGRVPLLVEIKSRFDADHRLAQRVAGVLGSYAGPAAAMSFDPTVVTTLRSTAPGLIRGIVAEERYDHPGWHRLSPLQRWRLAHLLHVGSTRPHFVAYAIRDLPAPAPLIARRLFGLPLLAWTVRSSEERRRAAAHADQIIFEGWRP